MAVKFSKKQISVYIISILFITLLFLLLYFTLLKPVQIETARLENDLATQRQLLEVVQSKVKQTQDQTVENTVELQKKVPVKPVVEQFLLDLEKAEVVSNSFITNMGFKDAEVTDQSTLEEYVESTQDDNEDETNGENQPNEAIQLPQGIKKLTVNLSVQSPDYYAMEQFINTLETQTRITQIENLAFSGQEEITSVEQEIGPIAFTLSVSTFYLPKLTDLVDQLPVFEILLPSNKQNPFPSGIKDNE